ncbi:MAG: anti-sigma factor [Actinomycetota bacterium]
MNEIHDQVSSLIAAYAIGAVPEEEIPAIRAHILGCEQCYSEAETYAQVALALTETVEPVALPPGFDERVLAHIRGAQTESRPVRSSWHRRAIRPLAVGAAAVLVGLLVLVSTSYLGSVQRQRQYQQAVAALVHDPDALTLTGPGGAEAVLASTATGSVLVALDLGEAPNGRDYQLWLMQDGEPTPADTFDVSESVVIVESDLELSGYDGAAITVEPDGGSEQPSTEPVLSSG